MKQKLILVLFVVSSYTYAQKKSNGTIYQDHPAIKVVEAMTEAYVKGDADKVASYLADDFKSFNGLSTNADDKGVDKKTFLESVKYWKDNTDYLSITTAKGTYPDALEYKDENQKDVTWVQTWETLKGVDKKTGVKLDMPMHRLFVVNKDNKIKSIIGYTSSKPFMESDDSFVERTNGTIYNHHENINTIRKMIYAFENKDYIKSYSFYDEKANFSDISAPDKNYTLTEQKDNDKKMLEKFDLVGIDMVGYPDYLHYELNDARVVLSWWNFRLIRKSDKKSITMPIFFIDNFDDKGKIVGEMAYYSAKLLEQ
jgi:hypothetical protein